MEIKIHEEIISPFKSKFIIEPLHKSFGNTMGNSLRRTLIAAISGSAIKGVKIDGVLSEFSVIEGVKETVVDILLNVKEIVLSTSDAEDTSAKLHVKGPKIVRAKDIKVDRGIKIINPDQIIATITKEISLDMEFIIGSGRGFVVAEDINKNNWPIGFFAIDAIYSPVVNVSYQVEETRVGKVMDYEKLTLELETNGSISQGDILSAAVADIMHHFTPLVDIGNRLEHLKKVEEIVPEDKVEESTIPDLRIEDLDLSVRSYNCLKKAGVNTLKELVKLTTKELSAIKNLGKSSVNEITSKIKDMNI